MCVFFSFVLLGLRNAMHVEHVVRSGTPVCIPEVVDTMAVGSDCLLHTTINYLHTCVHT
jgi:hypothetical protein